MNPTRRDVFERLAATSAAEPRQTTTLGALSAALGVEEGTVEGHVEALAACELARTYPDGRVRVTVTAEQLLELDIDDSVIVDAVADE